MVRIAYGTEVYGKVKKVGGTSIVTKFWMLQFLPIYPVQSFYIVGNDKTRVPFRSEQADNEIQVMPLAYVDRTSATMAYLRAVFTVLLIFGFFAVFGLYPWLTGSRLSSGGKIMTTVCCIMFLIGSIGGLLTYWFPGIDPRDKKIRLCCGEILGMCIDPLYLPVRSSSDIENQLKDMINAKEIDTSPQTGARNRLLLPLIATRCRLARAINTNDSTADALEQKTDELLAQLRPLRASNVQEVRAVRPPPRKRQS